MISFFTHFVMSSIVSTAIILPIILTKCLLKKHITIRWQYNIGLLILILLAVPFIPADLLQFADMGNGFNQNILTGMGSIAESGIQPANQNLLQDFSLSVNRPELGFFIQTLMFVWLTGIFIILVLLFYCNKNLRLIIESTKTIKDDELIGLFKQCKSDLGCMSNNVLIGTSVLVKSPITIGFFKVHIILPFDTRKSLTIEEIRYIILHELAHCKNKDLYINNIMCLFQILYWFNPIVHLAFKVIRLERELACDLSVLKLIPQNKFINYGETLLKFVSKSPTSAMLSLTTEIGDTKSHIKKRVENIVGYKAESSLLRLKSICVFTLSGLLIFSQIPNISAMATYDVSEFNFWADNINHEDLSSYFNNLDGSFVLYDLGNDSYTIHNHEKSIKRVSPDSTYKIYSSLIAFETGVIDLNDSKQAWDGTKYPFQPWNDDQNLTTAMHNSVNWYFQNIDKKVGISELNKYFSELSYGNCDLSGGLTDFWLESSLKISPVEQVILLKALYQNNTIFKTQNVDEVKKVLRLSEKGGAALSGKTGTGSVNGKSINGWFIGYVEKHGNTFIFATNICSEDNANGSTAMQITLDILYDKDIY